MSLGPGPCLLKKLVFLIGLVGPGIWVPWEPWLPTPTISKIPGRGVVNPDNLLDTRMRSKGYQSREANDTRMRLRTSLMRSL
jgi:hypothetical protein